jgi:hypothetical protein
MVQERERERFAVTSRTPNSEPLDHVDDLMESARSAWRAGIDRDEAFVRRASERRLTRAWPSGTPSVRWMAAVAATSLACGALAVVAFRHAPRDSSTEIRSETPVVAPAAAPVVPEVPSATPPAPPPTVEPEKMPPPVAKRLPPLPPASAAPETSPQRHSELARLGRDQAKIDRRALHMATLQLKHGNLAVGRAHLRVLARHAEPELADAALMALARSYDNPREELGVWEEALRSAQDEEQRARVKAERARVLLRLSAGSR